MKNTRISRLKRNKKFKQATKLLTVVLLICPLAIGTIKALADEAETTPPVEQVAETPATTEESMPPAEATEASSEQQPDIEDSSQAEAMESFSTEEATPEQPSETLEESPVLESAEAFATRASYQETFYTSSQTPFWTDDDYAGGGYTFTFSDGKQINVGFASLDSDNFNWELIDSYHWTGGDVKGGGSSGQEISFSIAEDTYKATIIVDTRHNRPSYNVSFAIDGNGSLSSINTLQVPDGSVVSNWTGDYRLPVPTANPGYHFVGWYNGQWVSESSFFIVNSSDMTLTAKFEAGDLDWSMYDGYTGTLLAHVNAKEPYEYFGYSAEWSRLNQHYIDWITFKEENFNNPSFPQISISGPNSFNGILANIADNDRIQEMKMSMNDYLNSVKAIYQDNQNYTQESKEKFDSAYETLNQYQVNEWGVIEGDINVIFDAYQALKTAEQNLVKATTPEIPVEGIFITKQSMDVDKGYSENLVVVFTPENASNKGIIWSSSNDSIVSVDKNGKIIAKSKGTALITATSIENSDATSICIVSVNDDTPPVTDVDTTKLENSIKDAEAKLTAGGYTAQSMSALKQALQNAKDILANASSTQAEIDEAQKALDLAIANLVKEDNSNGGNTGNNSSNDTGNSSSDPNNSSNGTTNTNNQTNNKQNSTTTTTKPAGNNTTKDGLPQTGEQSATNAVIAGLSLTMFSIFAWFKRKKV